MRDWARESDAFIVISIAGYGLMARASRIRGCAHASTVTQLPCGRSEQMCSVLATCACVRAVEGSSAKHAPIAVGRDLVARLRLRRHHCKALGRAPLAGWLPH